MEFQVGDLVTRDGTAVHRVAKDFYGNTDQMHAAALILSEIEAGK